MIPSIIYYKHKHPFVSVYQDKFVKTFFSGKLEKGFSSIANKIKDKDKTDAKDGDLNEVENKKESIKSKSRMHDASLD